MNFSVPWNNATNASTTHVSPRGTVLVVVESLIFLVLDVTALVGNILVCVAFYRNPSLRTVTNNFVLSLALTDLLMAVFVMPVYTASSIANRWIAGDIGFKLVFYCHTIAGIASLYSVMLVAINRYFRVVKPELYRKIYSKKSSTFMVATSWIVALLTVSVGFPLLEINFANNEFNPAAPKVVLPSGKAFLYYSVGVSFNVVTSSLIVTLCYVKIYQTIRQHNMAAAPQSQEGNSSYGVEEARMTRLLTVVVVAFYLYWIPYYITNILEDSKLIPETKYRTFYRNFPLLAGSVINPMVYGVMCDSFRSEFLKIIRCR